MRKSSSTSFPSLRLRIDLDKGHIGPGKIELLENIQSCGSISAAGRAMEMSYRRAWMLVENINHVFNRAAVEAHPGGKDGGGATLTPFGLKLVSNYRTIERSAERATRKQLRELLVDIGES
jgi:molybdate transport system regulatory protein